MGEQVCHAGEEKEVRKLSMCTGMALSERVLALLIKGENNSFLKSRDGEEHRGSTEPPLSLAACSTRNFTEHSHRGHPRLCHQRK